MRILYRNFRKSARLLARALGVKAYHVDRVSYHRGDDFRYGFDFTHMSRMNKAEQRKFIAQTLNLPVPYTILPNDEEVAGLTHPEYYIARPVSHYGGDGFHGEQGALHIIKRDPSLENLFDGPMYLSALFEKTREYRILFVKGKFVTILAKTPREGVEPDPFIPWNHATGNFRFVTTSRETYAGRKFEIIERLERCFDATGYSWPDIVGFDVGYNPENWVVFEMNLAPALTDVTLPRVVSFLTEYQNGPDNGSL